MSNDLAVQLYNATEKNGHSGSTFGTQTILTFLAFQAAETKTVEYMTQESIEWVDATDEMPPNQMKLSEECRIGTLYARTNSLTLNRMNRIMQNVTDLNNWGDNFFPNFDTENKVETAKTIIEVLHNYKFPDDYDANEVFQKIVSYSRIATSQDYNLLPTDPRLGGMLGNVLSKMLPEGGSLDMYDPSMGTGSLLVTAASQLAETRNVNLYGKDIMAEAVPIAKYSLILNGFTTSVRNAKNECSLENLQRDSKNSVKKFQVVITNPSFDTTMTSKRDTLVGNTNRFTETPTPSADSFVYHFQDAIWNLDKNGYAIIFCPSGFAGAKKTLERLVDENRLCAVLHLPGKVTNNISGASVTILIVGPVDANRKVSIVDATKWAEDKSVKLPDGGRESRKYLDDVYLESMVQDLTEPSATAETVAVSCEAITKAGYSLNLAMYFKKKQRNYCPKQAQGLDDKIRLTAANILATVKAQNENNIRLEASMAAILKELS